jgi:hypothetical protein
MQEGLKPGSTLSPHLDHFRELEVFQMWGNSALEGGVPPSLSRLANLEVLCLNHNRLSGALSESLFGGPGLRFLSQLQLQENRLTGRIPDTLCTLRHLEHLNLGGNLLSGPIPAAVGRLANLRYLVRCTRWRWCIDTMCVFFSSWTAGQ